MPQSVDFVIRARGDFNSLLRDYQQFAASFGKLTSGTLTDVLRPAGLRVTAPADIRSFVQQGRQSFGDIFSTSVLKGDDLRKAQARVEAYFRALLAYSRELERAQAGLPTREGLRNTGARAREQFISSRFVAESLGRENILATGFRQSYNRINAELERALRAAGAKAQSLSTNLSPQLFEEARLRYLRQARYAQEFPQNPSLLDARITRNSARNYSKGLVDLGVTSGLSAAQILAMSEEERKSHKLLIEGRNRLTQRYLRTAAELQAANELQGRPQRTTFTQRTLAGLKSLGGLPVLPETQPTGIEQFGKSFANVLSYGTAGSVFFGALRQIKDVIGDAQKLQLQLAAIEAQMRSLGTADQFPRMRAEILDVAKSTGTAASQVANVALQLQGVFSSSGSGAEAFRKTIENVQSAIEVSRTTGLGLSDIVDSLTATMVSYNQAAEGAGRPLEDFRSIGDTALGIQERYGVLAKETIKFLGDSASVFAQYGLSLRDSATLIGAVQQASGRSGAAIAESFNRILPAIGQNALKLQEIIRQTGDPALLANIQSQLQAGDYGSVLKTLTAAYNDLNAEQQKNIVSLLGGRREAQVLIPLFQQSAKITRDLAADYDDSGKLANQFAAEQRTLSAASDRLKQSFVQLVETLFRGGLADGLSALFDVLGGIANVIRQPIELFAKLNDELGGLPSIVLASAIAMRTLVGTLNTLKGLREAGGFAADIRATITGATASATGQAAAARAAGGAGLLGGASLGVFAAGAGALAVLGSYAAIRSKIGADAKASEEKLKQASKAELEKIVAQGQNSWENVWKNVFGADTQYEQARKLLARQNVQAQAAAQRAGGSFVAQGRAAAELLRGGANLGFDLGESAAELVRLRNEAFFKQLQETGTFTGTNDEVQAKLEAEIAKQNKLSLGGDRGAVDRAQVLGDALKEYSKNKKLNSVKLNELIDKIEKDGDQKAFEQLQVLLTGLNKDTADKVAQTSANTAEKAAAVKRASDLITASPADLDKLRSDFEQGTLSAIEYLAKVDAIIESLGTTVGGAEPDQVKALQDAQLKAADTRRKFIAEQRKRANALQLTVAGASGISNTQLKRVEIDQIIKDLRNPYALRGVERSDAIQELIKGIVDWQNGLIGDAKEDAEKMKIFMQGVGLNEFGADIANEVQAELLGATDLWVAFESAFLSNTVNLANFTLEVAQVMAEEGANAAQAARQVIQNALAKLQALDIAQGVLDGSVANPEGTLQQIEAYQKALAGLDKAGLDIIKPFSKIQGTYDKASGGGGGDNGLESATKALEEAYAELRRAQVELDPVKLAELEVEIAKEQIARAEAAIAAAQAAGDQVAELQAQADQIRGQAALIRAERGVSNAVFDVFKSSQELYQVQAEIAGNDFEAAKIGLQISRMNYEHLLQLGVGQAELNRAFIEIQRAQGQLRDTELRTKLDELQFEYDMGEINSGQFIAALQALISSGKFTESQVRDLQRQIKQLQNSVAGDLKFNLPSEITLPTLYEARRLDQGGYARTVSTIDQRSFTFGDIIIGSQVDADRVLSDLNEIVNGPARNGLYPALF